MLDAAVREFRDVDEAFDRAIEADEGAECHELGHAADQDLPCLHELDLYPPEVFDTEIAGLLLGFPRVSLQAEIAEVLGADHLVFQEIDDLRAAIIEGTEIDDLDLCCFDGRYVTGTVSEEYLRWVEGTQVS